MTEKTSNLSISQSRAFAAILAAGTAIALLVAFSLVALIVEFAVPYEGVGVIAFGAIAEESARLLSIYFIMKHWHFFGFRLALIVGISFGALEVSNAFFPDNYISLEGRSAPFILLASLEFITGFILHFLITTGVIFLVNRIGIWAAFITASMLHASWNIGIYLLLTFY